MTKLGAIEFDGRMLDAIRDDRFIVFAGAGVSMGPPSSLASFWKLSCDIAQGTGLAPSEPLDRFLGQLHHRKIAVHERAAQLLSPAGSSPNALHHDLLRLFRKADSVRLVTTNFDMHFETAANALFGTVPDVYRAPALPRGYDFSGIVHVHGALPRARDLVLTDADFGRAYLTEGWARRFLVDMFRRYTVLFVGYSHNDIVMNYLARALPGGNLAGRFALTEEDGRWDLLGIKPIRFVKGAGADAFKELYDGVRRLAERTTRGALDWQLRLSEVGGKTPPIDEESIGEVEQALRDVHTTRFLLDVARDPGWLRWLNGRKHLDALFGAPDLGERDMLFVAWLAQHFAIEHSHEVFEIVASHGLRMNPALWWSIGREIGVMKEKPLEESALKRWATILLANAPPNADHHVLMWLAERCSRGGCVELTLRAFLAMSEYRLRVKPGFAWPDDEGKERCRRLDVECPLRADHWSLNEVWTKHLRPNLARVAQPLLSSVTLRLEEIHGELTAWGKATREWDPVSYGRSAIEPHEQDQYPEAVDVVVDAARDTLEWLAGSSPALLGAWIERLVASDVPLLRRLAVHAIVVHPERSPEERLKWLLDRVGLHQLSEHHEVHRLVALSYSDAADSVRKAVVDGILVHALPASRDWTAEMRTARSHFDWLSWLLQARPDCPLADGALAPIRAQYPAWRPSDHPDLTHWMGSADWVKSESPWSVEQLLAREPREQLDDLLSFKGNRVDGPNHEGLLANVREACKQNARWAFALGQALAERTAWSSGLWAALIRGLQEELPGEDWPDVLTLVSNTALQSAHAYEIANLLYALVRDGGKPFAIGLLEQANTIAGPLWQALEANTHDENREDWLSGAINCPAGIIVEFWINGLALCVRGKTGAERFLPEHYRYWFTLVVQDATSKGGAGRSLLASQAAFLFGLDEEWTRQHVIPLFSDPDRQRFAQAWDGFLAWGRLYPALVDALLPAFVAAMPRLTADLDGRRRRFVELYTALAAFHVSDPTQHLLPVLFRYGSLQDRVAFASYLGYCLRQMQQAAKQQLWNGWLRHYWQERLQGVFAALDEAEIRSMLDWLPHLGDVFPDAVALAVRFPTIRIEHSHVLFELRESELVKQFARETAELLIYLSNCLAGYHVADLERVNARLPPLPAQVRRRVDEAFARAGVLKVQN
ncbi:MAG: DUF4020 domain-containing protein [Planctomycetes bacterium]|nr:DUF4020 domain-containing protein [Planctomycetota bacterium]